MKILLHKLIHWLQCNYYGDVVTWWEGNELMVGFRCDTCGIVSGKQKAGIKFPVGRLPRPQDE